MPECLICGARDDLTVEHIIPQTFWKRFGIDPNLFDGDVPKTRTSLCRSCNSATAVLHERQEMMSLIETGSPTTKKTLAHLADWAFWVTLLLGLARGSAVIRTDHARRLLQARFAAPSATGGIPKGFRVYAGVAKSLESSGGAATSYAIARVGDPSVYLDGSGQPIGFTMSTGQSLQAAQSIGLGHFVLLVVAPTYSSGDNHAQRLDAAAASIELIRIHPPPNPIPSLAPVEIDVGAARNLFVTNPSGSDWSLLPPRLRRGAEALGLRSEGPDRRH